MLPALLVAVVVAYLLGSIPTGLWVVRRFAGRDIRQTGSGRTGATNVLRTAGKLPALVVVIVDIGKGVLAVLLGQVILGLAGVDHAYQPLFDSLTAFAAIAGHNWPVFAGFRGGRGVATGFGTLLAINPLVALITLAFGAVLIIGSDTVSLGSIGSAAFSVLVMWLRGDHSYMPYVVLGAAIVIVQHRDNIQRLLAGNERRLGLRDKLFGRFHPHA